MLHRLIKYSCIFAVHMSPALNRRSALQHFKHSNTVELCNGIMLDFYLGPPHMPNVSTVCIVKRFHEPYQSFMSVLVSNRTVR